MISVCLIGFGEVGATFSEDLYSRATLSAWDVLFTDPESKPSRAVRQGRARAATSAQDAVRDADVVISAVTAAQTIAAAEAAAPAVKSGAFFLDLNSAAPKTKIAAACAIEAAGGAYIEAAVMSPIAPKRLATPMLLSGMQAKAFVPVAEVLGLTGARFYDAQVGRAAAAKLCRSVMIKGIEALLVESLLAARHYKVEDEVIDSLSDLFPGVDWAKHSRYMITRALEHGARRAEEMHEAARTVADAGLSPRMSEACAVTQAWTARQFSGADALQITTLLDAMREKL